MPKPEPAEAVEWQETLARRLPLYGHRNWVAAVDSAYPLQARSGIETVATNADHLTVVAAVLEAVGRQTHVRPVVYLDAELPFVPEADAPGIGAYRDGLAKVLADKQPIAIPHADIIGRLDAAGAAFAVLVLKTTLTLPYTSVFVELDCRYWPAAAEERLQSAMKPRLRPVPFRS